MKDPKTTILLITGILLISTGMICNEWFLIPLLSSDGTIATRNRIIIWTFDLLIILVGLSFIICRHYLKQENALLLGFTISFCFILFVLPDCLSASMFFLKILLRHTFLVSKNHIFIQDNHLGWKPKANSIRNAISKGNFDVLYEIDQDGFRKINNTEKPDFSIYFFGDSFTFGNGVSNKDSFPAIIKGKYVKDNINVYNAGVSGYGIVQMFQRFLNIEYRIKPGDLIVFTPLADDIRRNIKDFYFPYHLYYLQVESFEYFPYFDEGVIKYHKMENSLHTKFKVIVLEAPVTGRFWRSLNKHFISDTTEESIEMMKIIKLRTEMKGARFVLFFLPETGECLNKNYAVDVSGFEYFDIMRFFPSQKQELDKLKFSKREGHWNAYGHEIAAKAIVETLINNKVIDKKYLKEMP